MTTLSLETSKKLYELLGEYEAENHWVEVIGGDSIKLLRPGQVVTANHAKIYPAPSFQELIRLLPLIGEKIKWQRVHLDFHLDQLAVRYVEEETEEAGIKACEEYLGKLIV